MSVMINNPNIYEINSRVWIRRFQSTNNLLSISNLPEEYWERLAKLGINYIWLMGVWETIPASVEKYCFTEVLMQEYTKALPSWNKTDVIGSPYAINNYKLNSILGVHEELLGLKRQLNEIGLKLVLDFIPNHFHADTTLLQSNPGIFLQADEELYRVDPLTFYNSSKSDKYFAHGKDPNFAAWQDTVQVNYFNDSAREFMTNILMELTNVCDGLRCDMAMLPFNTIFEKTWSGVIERKGLQKPKEEFWETAIKRVKRIRKDFVFIAEVYWNMEWTLQQQGFDFTYDKSLYERLKKQNAGSVNAHLNAELEYQAKSVRFIENHDEQRAIQTFGKEKSKAASVIISTIPGMHFYHDGQFEGKSVKLPVQLGKEPDEYADKDLLDFYTRLLTTMNSVDTNEYEWKLLECLPAGQGDYSYTNFIAHQWKSELNVFVVVCNYSDSKSYCRLKLDCTFDENEIVLFDKLNDEQYVRTKAELTDQGLFIALHPFHSHIFQIEL